MLNALLYMEQPERVFVLMTIYTDAVKAELQEYGRCHILGWFDDEINAIAAAGERALMCSALLSDLRRLPELVIQCVYKEQDSGHGVHKFKRGVRIKHLKNRRKVVMRPGIYFKPWLRDI